MTLKARAQAMSGAGLLVVLAMCLSLIAVIVTACVLAYQEKELPEVLDRVLQGLLIGVPALLAKTYRDATRDEDSDEPEPPTPVELVQETPVVTREVGAADAVGGAEPFADPRAGVPLAPERTTRRRT